MIFPNITKEYIFTYLSEEDIMEYYLGVSITFGELIPNPLRIDNTPTAGFFYSKSFGNLRFRDFTGFFHGDCFDVIAFRLNQNFNELQHYKVPFVDSNTSKGFAIILDKIARDFKLNKYSIFSADNFNMFYDKQNILESKQKQIKETSIFTFDTRPLNNYDKDFWNGKYYLQPESLKKYHVFPVQTAWINGYQIYNYYNNQDVCYAYYLGTQNGIQNIRFYFPYREKGKKFFINTSVIQGALLINPNADNCKYGLVIKGYKEVIVGGEFFSLQAVSPSAEGVVLNSKQANMMTKTFDYVFCFMDYDNAGIRSMYKHRKFYGFYPVLFTDNVKHRKLGYRGAKDLTDYIELYGVESTQKIIDDFIYQKIESIPIEAEMNFVLNYIKNEDVTKKRI